ncbi:MAG: zf-TFIIB domain-containing protein [Acidimicrobiales bacterium]|nr:zf-TFIIB domain-containing protein [Actinomycetota bacterium]
MKCPVDGATLEMSERQGVEIDYCPTCRGVWLDRGELDKIVERAESWSPPSGPDRRDWDRDDDRSRPHKKKRTSFLSELFEG